MPQLPSAFIAQMQAQLGTEFHAFETAIQMGASVSVRQNPAKPMTIPLESQLPVGGPVAWHNQGFYLAERPIFTLDPAFHAGAYYVQEASSMFIAHGLSALLDTTADLSVLDLCAAPGGKTTLLTALLPQSLILTNEVIKSRVEILKENVHKWGSARVHISHHDSEDFSALAGFFDLILVDAPCSGEGLFRKDDKAVDEWSESHVQLCAARQRRILGNTLPLLKPGGLLVYATCTYNTAENTDNVQWLCDTYDLKTADVPVPDAWGITPRGGGYQFYPHKSRGEGFFVSFLTPKKTQNVPPLSNIPFKGDVLPKKALSKVVSWIQNPDDYAFFIKPNGHIYIILKNQLNRIGHIDKALQRKGLGLTIGSLKGDDFIPSHELALSTALSTDIPRVELSKTAALHYLKKETIDVDNSPQGWVLATYNGLGLGWMKVLKNRINNYLPKDFRIRMDLPSDL